MRTPDWLVLSVLLLLAPSVGAREWCFGASHLHKASGTCKGKGWAVVHQQRKDRRLDCYLRNGGWKRGVFVTPWSVLYFQTGARLGDSAKASFVVDKQAPVVPDLVAEREGLEVADPGKRSTLIAGFKAGSLLSVKLADRKVTFSLGGFTRALGKYRKECVEGS